LHNRKPANKDRSGQRENGRKKGATGILKNGPDPGHVEATMWKKKERDKIGRKDDNLRSREKREKRSNWILEMSHEGRYSTSSDRKGG